MLSRAVAFGMLPLSGDYCSDGYHHAQLKVGAAVGAAILDRFNCFSYQGAPNSARDNVQLGGQWSRTHNAPIPWMTRVGRGPFFAFAKDIQSI